MRFVPGALITTVLLLLAFPNASRASITCTTATCQTVTVTITGDNTVSGAPNTSGVVFIPPGVANLSFYAKGGDGGNAHNDVSNGGAGGGGGACAYFANGSYAFSSSFLSNPFNYLLCVGGGGGGLTGGAGGSTAGSGVGMSGTGGDTTYVATPNGAGAQGSWFTSWGPSGQGGSPGHGGGTSIWYVDATYQIYYQGGGGGGGGGDIFSSVAFIPTFQTSAIYTNEGSTVSTGRGADGTYGAPGGYALSGGDGSTTYGGAGSGGGGGYGGGGGGGSTRVGGYNSCCSVSGLATGGGGGSSYVHSAIVRPDVNGFGPDYVSIPVSALTPSASLYTARGQIQVILAAGAGGKDRITYSTASQPGTPGTITMKYLCSAKARQACMIANACSTENNGIYDCSENCVSDYYSGATQ